MQKKEMSVGIIILLGILILTIGIGAGVGVSQLIVGNKEKEQQRIEAQEIAKQEVQNTKLNKEANQEIVTPIISANENVTTNTTASNTTTDSKINYDEIKTISVDGKKFTIAYDHKIYKETSQLDGDTYDAISSTIYLNGKAIKTINDITYFNEASYNKYNGWIEVNTIVDGYKTNQKYVVITFTAQAISDKDQYIIIVDQNENVVGTILGHYANDGVVTADNPNGQVQINGDNIVLFERLRNQTGALEEYLAAKYVIQVKNGVIWKNVEKIYSSKDAELPGR